MERVAASRYVSKSARLRDLLTYLCDRVIDESAEEIHEQEVGHRVFGRTQDYDTTADNIVRVHASTLRKRLEQYFSAEGAGEPLIIELPKGNYAPVFRERTVPEPEPPEPPAKRSNLLIPVLAGVAAIFACTTLWLALRSPRETHVPPPVRELWSQIFQPGQAASIVLDDAAVGLYQELGGKPIGLSEYFDRSYQRRPDADKFLIRRYSSFASTNLLWRLSGLAGQMGGQGVVHFAREYSFNALKRESSVLLGNSRSNPWIEAFEQHLGVRWQYDDAGGGVYRPLDQWAPEGKRDRFVASADGYGMAALLPNLGGTGSVLIISGSGGAAMSATEEFLLDEKSVAQLRSRLAGSQGSKPRNFPGFEVLLRIRSRSRETTVEFARSPR